MVTRRKQGTFPVQRERLNLQTRKGCDSLNLGGNPKRKVEVLSRHTGGHKVHGAEVTEQWKHPFVSRILNDAFMINLLATHS